MDLPKFKNFVIDLIKSITQQSDDRVAKAQAETAEARAIAENVSKQLTEANTKIQQLEIANTEQSESIKAQMAGLDDLSTELVQKFQATTPTPAADALVAEVQANPQIETPPALKSLDTTTADPTPVAATEAALQAIADHIEAVAA